MKFDSIEGGKIREDRWSWHTFERESDGTQLEVKLFKPTAAERLRLLSRYKITADKAKWGPYITYIAQKWWSEFKSDPMPRDHVGAEIENTPVNRALMLNSDEELLSFVQEIFLRGAKELDEGNDASAFD